MFFFTDVCKLFIDICEEEHWWLLASNLNIKINAITKVFREPPGGCFRIKIFFLQVSELNNKFDELSLKGWIRP